MRAARAAEEGLVCGANMRRELLGASSREEKKGRTGRGNVDC
jgi:hypothetical protein